MRWHGVPPVHSKVRKVIAVRRDPRGSRANLAPMALRGFKAHKAQMGCRVYLAQRDHRASKAFRAQRAWASASRGRWPLLRICLLMPNRALPTSCKPMTRFGCGMGAAAAG